MKFRNKDRFTTSLGVVVSLAIHGTAIALITMNSDKKSDTANDFGMAGSQNIIGSQAATVEITVENPEPAAPAMAPAAVASEPKIVTTTPPPEVIRPGEPLPAPKRISNKKIKSSQIDFSKDNSAEVAKLAADPTASVSAALAANRKESDKSMADDPRLIPQPVVEATDSEEPVGDLAMNDSQASPAPESVSESAIESENAGEPTPEPNMKSSDELAALAVAEKSVEPAAQNVPIEPTKEAAAPITTEPPGANAGTAGPASESEVVAPAQNTSTTTSAAPVQPVQSFLSLTQLPGNRPPVYSREMRVRQAQGRGQLVYLVTPDGTVKNIRLTKSTGFKDLDRAAVDAFSRYKFVKGQSGYTVHDFEFSLKGPAIQDASRLRTVSSN
jgi:protein TonB